jgi:hemolysin expression modulating protein
VTKTDYLMKFRRCATTDTLEKVVDHMREKVPKSCMMEFDGAVDHRKAEIYMKKLFDKVPPSVWRYIN